jgi:hypothetical protein
VSPTACFLLEETDTVRLSLRRFCFGRYDDPELADHAPEHSNACPAASPTSDHGYRHGCDTYPGGPEWGVVVGEAPAIFSERGTLGVRPETFDGDERWPTSCSACGNPMPDNAMRRVNQELVYLRSDTGERTTIRSAPDGALWYADWFTVDRWKGPDGRTLVAKCPGGHDWIIDSVASNCTLPDDVTHRCWMRHGTPPQISVDKHPEPPFDHTCAAGAGSIQAGDYHGFITNGAFT